MPAPARQLSVLSWTISRAPSCSHSGRWQNSKITVAMQPSSSRPDMFPSCRAAQAPQSKQLIDSGLLACRKLLYNDGKGRLNQVCALQLWRLLGDSGAQACRPAT